MPFKLFGHRKQQKEITRPDPLPNYFPERFTPGDITYVTTIVPSIAYQQSSTQTSEPRSPLVNNALNVSDDTDYATRQPIEAFQTTQHRWTRASPQQSHEQSIDYITPELAISATQRTSLSGERIPPSLRARNFTTTEMMRPRPKLKFAYERSENSPLPAPSNDRQEPATNFANDMNSHDIRVALERDAQRNFKAIPEESRSELSPHSTINVQPTEKAVPVQSQEGTIRRRQSSKPSPWIWRESRELRDRDSQQFDDDGKIGRTIAGLETRAHSPVGDHSYSRQHKRGLSQYDVESTGSRIIDGLPPPSIASSESYRQPRYRPYAGSRAAPDEAPRAMNSRESQPPSHDSKFDLQSNSGYVLTSAWTSYLKKATADQIIYERESRHIEQEDWLSQQHNWQEQHNHEISHSESGSSDFTNSEERVESQEEYTTDSASLESAEAEAIFHNNRYVRGRSSGHKPKNSGISDFSVQSGSRKSIHDAGIQSGKAHIIRQDHFETGYLPVVEVERVY
ncbi:uncharacterized protein V1518DRAFT_414887 [Limtongia smithiae]|uniref:uncharacterized protein n=1 Tax=Limtongia smithiae TaxID=1125753 RepID=UPI0034CF9B2C